jgi:hypothetical protein
MLVANIKNAIDPITDAVVYHGHKKTGNEYLTGVQLEGCRKWSIFVQYLSYEFVEDRLKLLPLDIAFVVILHSAAKTCNSTRSYNNIWGLMTLCFER